MQDNVEYIDKGSIFHGSATGVMGTRLDLVLCGVDIVRGQKLWSGLLRIVSRMDKVFNRFDKASELSVLGREAGMQGLGVSRDMTEALLLAEDYWDRTLGLFDVARGAMKEIEISETGALSLYGNHLDFGGFAKGFFARRAEKTIRAAGVGSAYLDFGGSTITAIGSHPYGDSWMVSLTDPYSGRVLDEIKLTDKTLSTSGNTASYCGHIVNPLTGEKNTRKMLVTVVAPDALDAEVLSTVGMIADEAQISEIRGNFSDVQIKVYDLG